MNSVNQLVASSSEKFVDTLTQYKWDLLPDSQLHAAEKALSKNDYIMKIATSNPKDVHSSLIQAAVLGVDLTEGKKQAWLLPRKNQSGKTVICLQVGYKGVEAIHQRMGVIDRLVIRVVRENDSFDWSGDDQEKPNHNAQWMDSDDKRGAISGAYAITYYPDKSINVTVTSISNIFEKHRNRSESYKSYIAKYKKGGYNHKPPWVSDEQSMVEKTMAYIASKQWPANIRDNSQSSKILETLHTIDSSDYIYGFTYEQKTAFFNFVDSNDCLGLFLFSQHVGIEIYSALLRVQNKTYDKGMIMKGKAMQGERLSKGRDIYNAIHEAISKEDDLLLSECLDGVMDVTSTLLDRALDLEQRDKVKELTKDL